MATDEPTGVRPAPVVLRIKLRYDSVETLALKFAPNVGKSGLFLPTKTLQAIGAELKFELRLSDDRVVITGLGRVKAAKAPDPSAPRAAYGMAIELMRVTRESRDVILKILAKRKELGLAEVAIPMPADIEAARGMVDTGVIDIGSVASRQPVVESGPIAAPSRDSAPILEHAIPPAAHAVLAMKPETGVPTSVPSVLTAPRRSGSDGFAKIQAVPALAPEAPRKKRAGMQELIDRASGSVQMVPGLDDDVDVAAVLARARSLAGSDLDAELEALRDASSAPIEISIEAASAELARQLGGAAVSRDRSARWAPPPPVEMVAPIQAPSEAAPLEHLPTPAVVEAAPEPGVHVESAPVFSTFPTYVDPPTETAPVLDALPDEMPADVVSAADAFGTRDSAPAIEVALEQVADELEQLDEQDFEEVEPTQSGVPMPAEVFTSAQVYTEPEAAAAIEHSVDIQLAAAEADDADDAQEDLGFGDANADEAPVYLAQAVDPEPDLEAVSLQHRAPSSSGYAMPDTYTKPVVIQPAYEPPYGADPAHDALIDPPLSIDDLDELEEIDDFEILAEADADDADLLVASGEHDASASAQFPPQEPYARPSVLDFAERLELSDEHLSAPEDAHDPLAAFETQELAPPPRAYAPYGDAGDDDPYAPGREDTNVSDLSDAEDELPPSGFPPLHRFDESDVIRLEPQFLRGKAARPTSQPQPATRNRADGYDLETALEALDVDLDDLSIPHQKTELPGRPIRPSQRHEVPARVPTRLPRRAETDEGVLIDFDDDDD